MILKINENIRIWRDSNLFEVSLIQDPFNPIGSKPNLASFGLDKERIAIKDRWFDVLTTSDLVRKRNKKDGYYRVVYIQINMVNGEYYIGKANRPKWSDLSRYKGSGLKFRNKLKKYGTQFVRFYIAAYETAEETEKLEASIVDSDLLADEKCLNLVSGGGGTSKHRSIAETSDKKREYMLKHPEQFKPMLEASAKAFQSGDTPALHRRSRRIKEVMKADSYREMSRTRIEKWKKENPEEYAKARRKNHEAIKATDVQEKRKASLSEWRKKNPEKHQAWEARRLEACTNHEAKEKRRVSLKKWRENNPEQATANAKKRAEAATSKLSKEVCMLALQSGEVLRTFPSQHAAAIWLVENGKAKNIKCVASISSVCLRKPCTTGYGYRKKAYGYDWRFKLEIETKG
jgi:hypothetical protein